MNNQINTLQQVGQITIYWFSSGRGGLQKKCSSQSQTVHIVYVYIPNDHKYGQNSHPLLCFLHVNQFRVSTATYARTSHMD
ncbi:hypothetical protein C5B42_03795 [Candidatus Cerribacteria bacterium 'Amazon FNV 2010 28 9']|uniref:Uncharacterized protein n=1 Tax=Candidatus Cerribacteria bacterium 'Amazon FNV 2010 28 9' TaxID=2081795 RepID=A0A317JTE4_9BACT|nr:MAG: hypothetical protein C5B42_03795 [Candidatus Cerribacteria bacterium 'Amazon FNV 2010 28 9']